MSRSDIRTRPIKGLVIFDTIGVLVSLAAFIWFIIFDELLIFRILIFVFCPIFIIAGTLSLIDQLFHYLEVKGDRLHNHILWIDKSIKIEAIEKLELKNGMFYIYHRDKKFASMPSHLAGADKIIIALERHNVYPVRID